MPNDKTYFILSREIFNSAIWLDNPHVLKLFVYLIGNARYKDEPKKYPKFQVDRGDVLTSLHNIAEANEYEEFGTVQRWSRMKVSRMLKKLEEQGYIKYKTDTYGTHISICNYNTYQQQERYKTNNGVTGALQGCYEGVTNSKKEKKEKKVKKDIYGEFSNVKLSEDEYKKLIERFGEADTKEKIENISLYISSKGDKYKNHYATILSWAKKETPKKTRTEELRESLKRG